jgi:hypothetical protein
VPVFVALLRSTCLSAELEHFNLEGCQLMTDAAILALTESPLPLTWLNFSYCLDITDVGVAAVASKCSRLVVRSRLQHLILQSRLASITRQPAVSAAEVSFACTRQLSRKRLLAHACGCLKLLLCLAGSAAGQCVCSDLHVHARRRCVWLGCTKSPRLRSSCSSTLQVERI